MIKTERQRSGISRTPSYVGTVTTLGDPFVETLRESVKTINRIIRANEKYSKHSMTNVHGYFVKRRFRVTVHGRLGKNNPYAYLYRRGGKHWRRSSMNIRPEHSTYFDVYVREVRTYVR